MWKSSLQGGNMLSLQKIIDIVQEVSEKYPFITKAELFGSYSRNQATESSDVDVLVEYDYSIGPYGFGRFQYDHELEEKLGVPVNVCTEQAFVEHYLDYMIESIKNDRKVIYEKRSTKN